MDFARIFDKLNFWGCTCTPCTPAPYTTASSCRANSNTTQWNARVKMHALSDAWLILIQLSAKLLSRSIFSYVR